MACWLSKRRHFLTQGTFCGNVKCAKKRSANTGPLREPRPRGAYEQHLADAPVSQRERHQGLLHMLQEPFGPGWSFSRKQNLTHSASIKLSIWPVFLATGSCFLHSSIKGTRSLGNR